MSDEINDGGPEFPFREQDGEGGYERFQGMSLRDYFAAAALTGLCASFDGPCLDDAFVSGVSRRAFDVADAMLQARERKEGASVKKPRDRVHRGQIYFTADRTGGWFELPLISDRCAEQAREWRRGAAWLRSVAEWWEWLADQQEAKGRVSDG